MYQFCTSSRRRAKTAERYSHGDLSWLKFLRCMYALLVLLLLVLLLLLLLFVVGAEECELLVA